MLQGKCFLSRLDYLQLKSNHAKFQLNPIRNGWVMVQLEIVQRCMEYCSAAGSMFCLQTSSFPSSCKISAHSVRKWLWYSQYKHLLLMGGWVGWDRKVIIKSSRTFNPKFLTQSFSRLKFFCNTNFFVTYNFLGLKFLSNSNLTWNSTKPTWTGQSWSWLCFPMSQQQEEQPSPNFTWRKWSTWTRVGVWYIWKGSGLYLD